MEIAMRATPAADEAIDGRTPAAAGAAPFLATHGAVEARPGGGNLRFRATHRWDQDARDPADAALPPGGDGPMPEGLDLLPHAIAACITAGMASIAAARGGEPVGGVRTMVGEIDLRGVISVQAGG